MKRLLFIIVATLFIFSSCSMSDIFEGNDPDVICPAEVEGGEDIIYNGMDPVVSDYRHLISAITKEHNFSGFSGEGGAVIVNDESQLRSAVNADGEECIWPEIDFENYSLVVGVRPMPITGFLAKRFRIVEKKDHLEMYIDVRNYGPYLMTPAPMYYAVRFPKLPDLPVKVIIWDEKRYEE